MGVIVNSVANGLANAGSGVQIDSLSSIGKVDLVDKLALNSEIKLSQGAKSSPVLRECRNIFSGMTQGDFGKAAINAGVLALCFAPMGNNGLKLSLNQASTGSFLAKIGAINQIVKGPQPVTLPDPMDPRNPGVGPKAPKDPRVPNPYAPDEDDGEPHMTTIKGIKGCSMNMQPDKDLGGDKPGNEGYQRHNRNPFWTYGQKDADRVDPV